MVARRRMPGQKVAIKNAGNQLPRDKFLSHLQICFSHAVDESITAPCTLTVLICAGSGFCASHSDASSSWDFYSYASHDAALQSENRS
jgi:hypothetical protein